MMINYTSMYDGLPPLSDTVACQLRIMVGPRFDIPALRSLRRAVAEAGDVSRLELDFAAATWLDAAALRLLTGDLVKLEERGTHIVARRLPDGFAERISRHPLRRFTSATDELFTDPDREGPGFLPSDR